MRAAVSRVGCMPLLGALPPLVRAADEELGWERSRTLSAVTRLRLSRERGEQHGVRR
jgi:hypothetical protein